MPPPMKAAAKFFCRSVSGLNSQPPTSIVARSNHMQRTLKYLSLAALCAFSSASCLRVMGQGTVFTNLHSFVYTNGTGPVASLLSAGGVLYGTTRTGGENG